MSRNETNGAVKFYINGVLNGSGTSGSGAVTTAFTKFGVRAFPAGAPAYFNGSLDNLRLTPSIQSDARIKAEYKLWDFRRSLTIQG